MPITEAQLLEKETALKEVQIKLEGLLNDAIPDEEQPEILELKKKVELGLNAIDKMRTELSLSEHEVSLELKGAVTKVRATVNDLKKRLATLKQNFLNT